MVRHPHHWQHAGSGLTWRRTQSSHRPDALLDICRTKDGQDVKAGGRVRFLYEDDESMSMIIKGVTPEDAGTYTVTAWNDMGEDFAEVTLNVKGKEGTALPYQNV